MSIGSRLKNIRESEEIKQESLASKLGINRATISMYERDKRVPSPEILKKYSDIFNVSIDYLLENNSNNVNKDYVTVNVYGEVPAGIPIEAIEDITDTEDLSFNSGYSPNKNYIGIKVIGDSMYPKYIEGDTIIVEVTPDCESGQDAVVYVNGYNATLKTVYHNDDGSITLKPYNPQYPPKTFGRNPDDPEIKILGVVKEIRRSIV